MFYIHTGKPVGTVWYEKQGNESKYCENEDAEYNDPPVEKTSHYGDEKSTEYTRKVRSGHDYTPQMGLSYFSGISDSRASDVG